MRGRPQGVALDRRDHAERQALQLDTHVERDQVAGRDHHQHADTPEDVAAAALFLASDEANFITGVVLPIDGGAPRKIE